VIRVFKLEKHLRGEDEWLSGETSRFRGAVRLGWGGTRTRLGLNPSALGERVINKRSRTVKKSQ
jgi:hypothetical protein